VSCARRGKLSFGERRVASQRRRLVAGKSTQMKVHPGMLMKTKDGRFQVSGGRRGKSEFGRAASDEPTARAPRPVSRTWPPRSAPDTPPLRLSADGWMWMRMREQTRLPIAHGYEFTAPPSPRGIHAGGRSDPPSVAEFRQWEEKKMLKKHVQSLNVYENKHTQDTMPEKNQTFMSKFRTFLFNGVPILQESVALRGQFVR